MTIEQRILERVADAWDKSGGGVFSFPHVLREAARSAGGVGGSALVKTHEPTCAIFSVRPYATCDCGAAPAPAATTHECDHIGAWMFSTAGGIRCGRCGNYIPETPGPSQPVSEPERALNAALHEQQAQRAADVGLPFPPALADASQGKAHEHDWWYGPACFVSKATSNQTGWHCRSCGEYQVGHPSVVPPATPAAPPAQVRSLSEMKPIEIIEAVVARQSATSPESGLRPDPECISGKSHSWTTGYRVSDGKSILICSRCFAALDRDTRPSQGVTTVGDAIDVLEQIRAICRQNYGDGKVAYPAEIARLAESALTRLQSTGAVK